jgi:pimeloyl-ACP methyl ester carboxylesterase
MAPGQRVHVVGHSLGAAVSLYFAHAHPARVERLVLVDAAGILLKIVFAQHLASRRLPRLGIEPVDRFLRGLEGRIDGFRRGVFSRLEEGFDFSLCPASQADASSQGSVVCENRTGARYSGVFDSITLDHCMGARIVDARTKQLTLRSSSLHVENSLIYSSDVALSAQRIAITATDVRIRGRVAIRAEHSRLDLAGVSLRASESGVELPPPSRLFFSVSDWYGSDHSGDAHFQWPRTAAPR